MTYGTTYSAEVYTKVANQTAVESASAHRLIQMLLEGALSKLSLAQGMMTANEYTKSAEQISTVIAIVDSLRASLNHDAGGEIANNLHRLYDYMENRLLQANLNKDANMLVEVGKLLGEIKSGWDGIADQVEQS